MTTPNQTGLQERVAFAREVSANLRHMEQAIKDDRLYTPLELKVQDYIEAQGVLSVMDSPEIRALYEAAKNIWEKHESAEGAVANVGANLEDLYRLHRALAVLAPIMESGRESKSSLSSEEVKP